MHDAFWTGFQKEAINLVEAEMAARAAAHSLGSKVKGLGGAAKEVAAKSRGVMTGRASENAYAKFMPHGVPTRPVAAAPVAAAATGGAKKTAPWLSNAKQTIETNAAANNAKAKASQVVKNAPVAPVAPAPNLPRGNPPAPVQQPIGRHSDQVPPKWSHAVSKAKTYTKGMVTGGVITSAGFGLNAVRNKANEGAMQPIPQGYY